jgi:arsenate reductase
MMGKDRNRDSRWTYFLGQINTRHMGCQGSPGYNNVFSDSRMQPMQVTIYHNPRCSKSRATLQLLKTRGIEPRVIEYLKEPPDAKTLETLLLKLRMKPRDLMRKGEPAYRELGLDDPDLGTDALIRAMVEHPILIERPIVVAGARAIIGRPPEKILELL